MVEDLDFFSFEDPEAVDKAVDALNGKVFSGKVLYTGRARQTELKGKFDQIKMESINRYQGVNVYVKNLDNNIDDERLRKEFAQFGTITSAKVMSERGRSRGFGFVCFSSQEEATKAVTEMNGRIVVAKPLYVDFAQRKEERKARQYMKHITSMRMQGQQMGQVGQMFQPGGAGYFVPTMPQAQRFYGPNNMPTMKTNPRWQTTTVRPTGQPASGFQTVPGALQIRRQRPTGRPTGVGAHPVSGQSGTPYTKHMPVSQQVTGRPQGSQPSMPAAANCQGQEPLTATMLATAPPQEQKQMLGDRLFPLISSMFPDMAGKITGMLLELDNSELLHMMKYQESLEAKVKEAVGLL